MVIDMIEINPNAGFRAITLFLHSALAEAHDCAAILLSFGAPTPFVNGSKTHAYVR
jgi:hypothetical protein